MKGIRVRAGLLEIRLRHKGRDYYRRTELKPTKAGYRDAIRRRDEMKKRLDLGLPADEAAEPEVKPGSFADVAQGYLDEADLKSSTRTSYKNLLNTYWMPRLGHDDVQTITLARIKQIARETKWSSTKVKKNAASALRQVFDWAVEEEYVTDNPAARYRTKRPKEEAGPAPDPYTIEERNTLLAWIKQNSTTGTYAYFLLAFHSGMRTGEMLALQWPDFDGGSFMVERSRTRGKIITTKTSEARRVLIPEHVCKVISALPSRFLKSFVFVNQYNRPYQSGHHLNEVFLAAHKATGTRRSTSPNYPWRHTYASVGLTSGAPPAFLAAQLGHSMAVFEKAYAKWMHSDEDRARVEALP